jgi:hypothetical protein
MKCSIIAPAASAALLMLACAADPGTRPHDMSQAQHEAMAKNEENIAEGHAERHDPSAAETKTQCPGKGGCWTSISKSPRDGAIGGFQTSVGPPESS